MSQCSDHVLHPLKSKGIWEANRSFHGARARAPQELCERGSCRHLPWVPIYKNPRFEQTAAIRALKMVSGWRCGARLKPVARPSIWWEIQLKVQVGKPRTCQAPSHSSTARRSIKMSLSLGCRWLCYPVRWPAVIKLKKKKANIIFALFWPSSGLFQTIID